ncbi:DUF6090 family protein [Robiginitalea aurantiaca]|uniref:DUF6090 family protein n=1 Tax=Robiginitalea aurantiaca TaxID=3056915 RepID=A0ABT7WDX4_9FLAO|nr:DUF6090 family protein [Robiginitalea aurantiaca]MDM9631115.1 DUF6090 family protein [Robiginitalea aurantiaca]
MIRFLSRFRKDLLANKLFGRYLIYAIGEIVLVVLGIVIALQIDNWNEWRQEREVEQIVLRQLEEDYESNLKQLNQKVEIRKNIIQAALGILQAMDQPEGVARDSLIANLTVLLIDPTFDPIENDMSSTGNLRLITNHKLKRLLSTWSADIVAVREIEQDWSKIIYQQYQPVVTRMGLSRDMANHFTNDLDLEWQLDPTTGFNKVAIGKSTHNTTVSEIIRSEELEGLVSYAITYNSAANLESETLRKRIEEILMLIRSEIHD